MTSPAAAPRDDGPTAAGPARPAAGSSPSASEQPRVPRQAGKHDAGEDKDRPQDGPGRRTADIDAYIRGLVAGAPPLTPAQRDRLALLFNGASASTARLPGRGRKDKTG
jgi:hypothetical protein